jgi:hypothetical protein
MLETYLVPEKTVVTSSGDGPLVNISGATNRVFLLTLDITGVVEQESIDVSIFGGPDEANLGKTPLASFQQQFYAGTYPLLLGLSAVPSVSVLRTHWQVNRWGRGPEQPWFEFSVKMVEAPLEVLDEVQPKG